MPGHERVWNTRWKPGEIGPPDQLTVKWTARRSWAVDTVDAMAALERAVPLPDEGDDVARVDIHGVVSADELEALAFMLRHNLLKGAV